MDDSLDDQEVLRWYAANCFADYGAAQAMSAEHTSELQAHGRQGELPGSARSGTPRTSRQPARRHSFDMSLWRDLREVSAGELRKHSSVRVSHQSWDVCCEPALTSAPSCVVHSRQGAPANVFHQLKSPDDVNNVETAADGGGADHAARSIRGIPRAL